MRLRAVAVGLGIVVPAIVIAGIMCPALYVHVYVSHGSQWWLLALLLPALIAVTGIATMVALDDDPDDIEWRTHQQEQAAAAPKPSPLDGVAKAAGVLRTSPFLDHPLAGLNGREER